MSLIKMMLVMVSVAAIRSEERFSRNAETDLVCRLLLEKKKYHAAGGRNGSRDRRAARCRNDRPRPHRGNQPAAPIGAAQDPAGAGALLAYRSAPRSARR